VALKRDLDIEVLYDLSERGLSKKEMASELGISTETLSKRMSDIRSKQGLLMEYRAIQSLQLTELQARVLEAITPEKIQEAPLGELVKAYKILKDHELTLEGKPKELKGLVGYLIQIEKEEAACKGILPPLPSEEAEFTEITPIEEEIFSEGEEEEKSPLASPSDWIPNL